MKHLMNVSIVAVLTAIFPLAAQAGVDHHHEGDIVVGRTGANVLSVEFDFDEPTVLAPVSGLLNGWAGDEPGFDHLEADEPAEDFYMLAPGASVVFELLSIDPALVGNPLTDPLDSPGDSFVLGDHELHQHIDWLIDADSPSFNPAQTEWSVMFRLSDAGATGYGDSEIYTWRFTNVPEPATAALLLAGAVALVRRRR